MIAIERASGAWGDSMPEWVRILAQNCDQSSQARVADKLSYSPAVVNTVLGNSYKGDLSAVKKAVEGALMASTVVCPVLGDLPANRCLEYQKREFATTNTTRVRLYKACRNGCPHSRLGGWQ